MDNKQSEKMIEAMFQGMAELRKSQAGLQKSQAELQKSQAELQKSQAETDRKLEEVGKRLGSIGINMGDFAEELFYSSLQENPVLGNIHYDAVERNTRDGKDRTEVDILLFNGDSAALVEVKYKAHPSDIDDLITRKAKSFRKNFREYRGHKLYMGLASTVSHRDLVTKAKEAGIYLLGQRGKHVELLNGDSIRNF